MPPDTLERVGRRRRVVSRPLLLPIVVSHPGARSGPLGFGWLKTGSNRQRQRQQRQQYADASTYSNTTSITLAAPYANRSTATVFDATWLQPRNSASTATATSTILTHERRLHQQAPLTEQKMTEEGTTWLPFAPTGLIPSTANFIANVIACWVAVKVVGIVRDVPKNVELGSNSNVHAYTFPTSSPLLALTCTTLHQHLRRSHPSKPT
ncbi:hypothetical protein BD410DRAFT_845599 [Rickenella mellea]|uniref:Uncharacterized protein n=1 Tax=Rickenella mellea TaxID=50990 RepID=A0A4Y7PHJ9_9AGAM|nr:hypothetical protein BD410DRAFT_845599 [Rickenella mellea]